METTTDFESVSYDRETKAYLAHHEWTSVEPLSDTLLRTVAAATGGDLTTLAPLQETLDVDSLDRLYKPHPRSTTRKDGGCLSLTFAGCAVTVYWDGKIVVIPHDDDTRHQL